MLLVDDILLEVQKYFYSKLAKQLLVDKDGTKRHEENDNDHQV
jgi:hypothetical protein